jgi:hypothetical protein
MMTTAPCFCWPLDPLRTDRPGRGLHYPSTVEKYSKHFPRIARDVGKHDFLKHEDDDDHGEG